MGLIKTKTTKVSRKIAFTTSKIHMCAYEFGEERYTPYLAQYAKIGKVIKRFRTNELDQCQFVLKLS